jgi:HlyD family secretion protein
MKFKKTMVTAVLLLAAAGAGYAYWRMGNGPKEPPYLTTPVAKANIRQVVSSTGTLQAVTTVLVGSQVSGTIAKLNVDFNSKVIKGQIVAELDQARFAARVEETRANVLAAQASFAKSKVALEDAERTLKRVKELKQRELVSQSASNPLTC